MPLLPTRQAPIVSKAKPSALRRWAQHILHLAKYGNKPAPAEPKRRAHATLMSDSDDDDNEEGVPGLVDTSDGEPGRC